MKFLIGIVIFCFAFAFVNCASVKATETNEQILERITKECDDSFNGRYIDPFNCQSYNRCVRGVLVKKNCPVGLGYDPESQVCQPKVEGCSITGIPKEETKEEILERITEECADLMDGQKRFVDPFNCQRYYRCIGWFLSFQDCGAGLGFDPKLEMCTPDGCSKK